MLLKKVKVVIIMIIVLLSSGAFAGIMVKELSTPGAVQQNVLPLNPLNGSFEFLSIFNVTSSYEDYGWSLVDGTPPPPVSGTPNYYGEPSLAIQNGTTLFSSRNVVTGDKLVSFQFAINSSNGNGSFSITNATGSKIATMSENNTTFSVSVPDGTPAISADIPPSYSHQGWTVVTGNLFNYSSGNVTGWRLQVFVDNTTTLFANVSDPSGYSYSGIEISASRGMVYFTNIIFTSYRLALFIPGYNNMEGYGQGSGALVSLLQPFTILHANFLLYNWSVARYSTLSFQINALNLTAAETQTAEGFFQLGVDLDPNGRIAPWYVPGKNAIAIYYNNHPNPDYMPGFNTPNNTLLGLTIQYLPQDQRIFFQIIDYSVNNQYRFWNTSIYYNGPEFYATYTQLETSSMNGTQLNEYRFNGTMFDLSYGSSILDMIPLNSSYMLPFSIDSPGTWSLTYYSDATSGYRQVD